MADRSNREVVGSPHPGDISVKKESVFQFGGTIPVQDSDTSNCEVVRSPSPVSVSISKSIKLVVPLDNDLIIALQQIELDKGKLWKDRNGRFRVVYKDDELETVCKDSCSIPEEDDNIDEYHTCMERVKIKCVDYSSEYLDKVSRFLEGITRQQDKCYPFTVIRNPQQQELITPSKSGSYREGIEYKVTNFLYKNEKSVVKIVKDMVTGFIHICKTTIMREFKCREVQTMHSLHEVQKNVAPEIYVVNRDGEHVNIHMELIKGPRLDTVATFMKDEHIWPLCLHIFSDILHVIRILMFQKLSHRDIHSKNIVIEVVENGKLRIRLIDYGDVDVYTISNLINDMSSLVANLLALLPVHFENDFNAYTEEPDNSSNLDQYPKLRFIFKRALEVANEESLRKFIELVEAVLVKERKKPDFKKSLEEFAELSKSSGSLQCTLEI